MADHDIPSLDFEEGEVYDNSDSEVEASPLDFVDEKQRYGSQHVPLDDHKFITEQNPQDEKHRTKRKHERKPQLKSRHSPALPAKFNGGYDGNDGKEFSMRSHSVSRKPSLKDYVSEDEIEFHISERERLAKRISIEERRRRKRRRADRPLARISQAQCRYFMEGRCHKGDACPYAHDFVPPKKQELCKFYAVGVCSKGHSCLYLHEEFPCKFFHISGKCIHGDSCKFSHSPLTPSTRALLDRVTLVKDTGHADNERASGGGHSTYGEHGDIDYRFGASISLHPRDKFDCPAVQRNLFAPNFPPEDRTRPLRPSFELRERTDMFPPLLRPPLTDGPMRPFCPDPHRPFGPSNIYRPTRFPPSRYPGPNNLVDRGFVPPPLHPANCQPLRSPKDSCSRPPITGSATHGPSVYDKSDWHPDFPTFHPPFVPPPGSIHFPTPFPTGTGDSNSEAIVSSELDKMAALLASSKPPSNRGLTNSTDPRTSALPADPRSENLIRANDAQATLIQNPGLLDDMISRRPSTSVSPPDLNVDPPAPGNMIPATVTWRLIPLDMNVKIPYPLMQLPIDDLPHRFEDPRLRGQLAAFRAHIKPVAQIDDVRGSNLELTESRSEISEEVSMESPEKADSVQRRPTKLQLNEMASTFSASGFNSVTSTNRTGDRSYLDDPRFRRRRIVTCVSTLTAQDTLTTSVTEAVDYEKNQPKIDS